MNVRPRTLVKAGRLTRSTRLLKFLKHAAIAALFIAAAIVIVPLHSSATGPRDAEPCLTCHGDPGLVSEDGRSIGIDAEAYRGSIHGGLDCVECHASPADYDEIPHFEQYVAPDCATCHEEAAETYRANPHGRALGRGELRAPDCAGCHGAHDVRASSDSTSATNPANIPEMCGSCHGEEAVTTEDYVRLPVSLPGYLASVHDAAMKNGKRAAVCTDCHGAHDLRPAADPQSSVNRRKVSETCGKCHQAEAADYGRSVHGKAVALELTGAPTCNDCHDEHFIQKADDPEARTGAKGQARRLCGGCHTDPELMAMYGIRAGVVESYLDSYHGWTVGRGGMLVATCTDCHNVHDINGPMDPSSSVHPANVAATCGRCHEGSNPTFARSYTHESALQARGYHGWARLIYLWVIALVLGSMVLHTSFVVVRELVQHFRGHRREPFVVRWGRTELVQHWILLVTFTGLAVTGFALRFPDAWWVRLIGLGGHEAVRSNLHRVLAVVFIANAIYHISWMAVTRRGRLSLGAIFLRFEDFKHVAQNISFMIGARAQRPAFGLYDYTQKIEYWSVVWGTFVMAVTGFVLWFPTAATSRLPAWIVRVSEVVHFYEAILAVSAVVIWHFFHVIFIPAKYPMSTVWIDGRIPAREWRDLHRGDCEQMGERAVRHPQESQRRPGEKSPRGQQGATHRPRRWAPRRSRDTGGRPKSGSGQGGPRGGGGEQKGPPKSRRRRPRRWRKKNP